jgi:spermidine synthase
VADVRPTAGLNPTIAKRIILLIFILSGFAGLVYEVVWARQLVLVFGNTTQAISAILTGFFGGMAIGSVVGGRLADRVRNPLRLYAVLELLVVIAVLLTPSTFTGLHEVYRGVFGTLEENPILLTLVRFGLALLALGPATILMGATLPTLSRYLVRDHNTLGTEFGSLYTVNTFGAILGTLTAGLVLIELIGLAATLLVGVACSGTAGVAAYLLSLRVRSASNDLAVTPAPAVSAAAAVRTAVQTGVASIARPKLALAVAFVSGLTSLGYQNLWTRMLSSGTGSSNYIFTGILAVFLAGIALGAFVFSRFLSKTRHPVAWLGVAEVALAALVVAGLGFETKFFMNMSFLRELVVVVAPPALVMGIVFPMSSMLVAESDDRVGTSTGLLLGSNTLGALCGTFVVPFVLMPILTSPRSVVLIAAINAVTGIVLLSQAGPIGVGLRRIAGAFGGVVAVAAIVLLVAPTAMVVDPAIASLHRRGGQVLGSAEDNVSTTLAASFPRANFSLQLFVGGNSMTTGVAAITRFMPDLPFMVRPDSKTMCIIAFGMGSSYRSALNDGLTVEAVELVPSVPEMFTHFYPDAAQVLANPRGHVIIADGRNHVELTTHMYDLLMVDPPPPMNTSGTAVLFSQEFYRAAKGRLNPGGVMMQWVVNDMTVDEFRSHARTFKSVFSHVTLVFSPMASWNGVLMLGSDSPIDLTSAGIESVLGRPGVVDDLSSAADSPPGITTAGQWEQLILTSVWISDDQVVRFGASGQLVTDDRPYTEYDLLRHKFGPKSVKMTKANLLAATPQP